MTLKTAVLIAGGKGTRLGEKTQELPKPLLPLGGKPILERIIFWLKENGVENIILGVAYKKEKIKEYFEDGSNFGVKIQYTEHDENGGTGDAFRTAIEKSNLSDENFYAMNSDQLTDLNLNILSKEHIKTNAIATLVTINLRSNFGIVKTDEKNNIIGFQEKPEIPGILMNSGIYVFNKRIKEYLVGGNIEENTFKTLAKEGGIKSFHHLGSWFTVNNKKELKKAEENLSKKNLKIK